MPAHQCNKDALDVTVARCEKNGEEVVQVVEHDAFTYIVVTRTTVPDNEVETR